MKKRFLATLTAFSMIGSVIPVSISAEDSPVVLTKELVITEAGQPNRLKLEAYVTGSISSSTSSVDTDIVLVLDQSGSMDETVTSSDGTSTTKLAAMKTAVRGFAEKVQEINVDNDDSYRLAVVGFASEDSNSEILTLDPTRTYSYLENNPVYNYELADAAALDKNETYYIVSGSDYEDIEWYNENWFNDEGWYTNGWLGRDEYIDVSTTDIYSRYETPNTLYGDALVDCTSENIAGDGIIDAAIDALDGNGATRADIGFEMAEKIFSMQPEGTYDNGRKKVVVFLTDGVPTTSSAFSAPVANAAVTTAGRLKADDTHIFSLYFGNPETDSANFLKAVSSNYPEAESYTVLGTQKAATYYSAHTDANEITGIFNDIIYSIAADVNLNEYSTVTDTISEYFRLPQTTGGYDVNQIQTYTVEKTAEGWADEEVAFDTARVTISDDGKTIGVTGFNYAYHCITDSPKTAGGSDYGRKLVIYIPIVEDEASSTFGGYLPTNDTAGIYETVETNEPKVTADSAYDEVTIEYSLESAERWYHIGTENTYSFNYDKDTMDPVFDEMITSLPDGSNNTGVTMEYALWDTNVNVDGEDNDDILVATLSVPAGEDIDVTDFDNWTFNETFKELEIADGEFSAETMYVLACRLTSTQQVEAAPTKLVYSLLDVEVVKDEVHVVGGVIDNGGTLSVPDDAPGSLVVNTYRETVANGDPSTEMTFELKEGYEFARIVEKTSVDSPLDTAVTLYDVTDDPENVTFEEDGSYKYKVDAVTSGTAIEVYTRLKQYTLTTESDATSEIMNGTTYNYDAVNKLNVYFAAHTGYEITSVKFGETEDAAVTYTADELIAMDADELAAIGVEIETAVGYDASGNEKTVIVDGEVLADKTHDNYVAITSDARNYKLAYKQYKREVAQDGTISYPAYDTDLTYTVAYNEPLEDAPVLPSKEMPIDGAKHTVSEWYSRHEKLEFSGITDTETALMPAANLVLHAFWSKNPDVAIGDITINKTVTGDFTTETTFNFEAKLYERTVGTASITVSPETKTGTAALSVVLTDLQNDYFVNGGLIRINEVAAEDDAWLYDNTEYTLEYDSANSFVMKKDTATVSVAEYTNVYNEFKVEYDLDGGQLNNSDTIAAKTVKWEDAELLPEGLPEKSGHTFIGWKKDTTDVDMESTYASLAGDKSVMSITLTAQWEQAGVPTDAPTDTPTDTPTDVPTDAPTDAPTDVPTDAPTDAPVTYVVKYNLNRGTAAEGVDYSNETVPAGTVITIKAEPTRAGYNFRGWKTDDATYNANTEYTVNADVTFTARWESTGGGSGGGGVSSYTLTYESNGGTEYEKETYKYGTVVNLYKVPEKSGFTFTGWYSDSLITKKIETVTMYRNTTVYAGWTEGGNGTPGDTPSGGGKDDGAGGSVPGGLNGDDHFAYVIGYPDDTVRPMANITRAEVAAIFFRLLEEETREANLSDTNTFADVAPDAWFNKAVSTMAKLGIVEGRDAETFDPDAYITRAEFAAICARFDDSETEIVDTFTDVAGHWAEAEIHEAAAHGWVEGYEDNTFRPENDITRAEAMTLINRVLCRLPETVDDLHNNMTKWSDNSDTTKWYYIAVQEATNSHKYYFKNDTYEKWTSVTDVPDWMSYQ